jgi:NACHT domain
MQIFWLSGDKGTGKTAISLTMSREWGDKDVLGGRFFFSQDAVATSTTRGFCLAIAKDVAAHIPSLQQNIQAIIGNRRILEHCGLEQQFRRMLIEPLEQHEKPIIIVVDGLDSVSDDIMRDQLIACLLKELPRVPKLKIFFSSRPLVDIEDSLGKSDLVERFDVHLPDNSDGTIHPDVSLYIEKNLEELCEDEKVIVTTLSQGHFLWLSSAAVMLRESRQREELTRKMCNANASHHVDGLYHIALNDAVHPMWPEELRMNVMRIAICALEPVSLFTLCALLRIPNKQRSTVEILVRVLGGLLKSGDANLPIRVRHADIRDFCLNPMRSKQFYVDSTVSNSFLARTCLELLEPHMRYNIRRIKLSGVMPWNDENIKYNEDAKIILNPVVAYASSYWPLHAAKVLGNNDMVIVVTKFLREQLLCWIELMSWRGCVGTAIEGLSYMRATLKSHKAPSAEETVSPTVVTHLHLVLMLATGARDLK